MTVLLVTFGELSVAVTARSTRSKVDQETDPDELALNWIPPQVNGELVPLKVNVMGLAAVPAAMRRPSRTTATLLIEYREAWARMRVGVSRAGNSPAQSRPRSLAQYIIQMAPLSRVIANSEPDNSP